MNNKYLQEAKEFLSKNNLLLTIREAIPQKTPIWAKRSDKAVQHGKNYYCSLSNKDGKHYSFDFWGSVKDLEENKNPNAYDVLACLDTYSNDDTFEDFCNTYGYDTDSITALETYNAVIEQCKGLKAILSKEAEEELNNIN